MALGLAALVPMADSALQSSAGDLAVSPSHSLRFERGDLVYVFGLFLAAKALLVVIALVAPLLFPTGAFFPGRATDIGLESYATRWDSNWYVLIARDGYRVAADGSGSVAFFPLFPMLMRGLMALGASPAVSGLIVANVSFLAALAVFFRLLQVEFGRRELAQHATALLAFSPGLAWFSVGYTESLFLLLTVALMLALRQRRWWWALGVGALAGLARPNAIVLLVPSLVLLMPELLAAWRGRRWRRGAVMLICAAAPLLGHALYLVYLQCAFGNWQANHVAEAQGWDARIVISWAMFLQKVPTVGVHLFDNPEIFREHVAWSWWWTMFLSVFSLIALWEARAPRWLSVFLVCFMCLYGAVLQLQGPAYSIARFMATMVPAYVAVALFAEKRPWAQPASLAVSATAATITALMLFGGYHIN
jgi:hypothetical protein